MTKIFDDSGSSNDGSYQIVTYGLLDLAASGPVYQSFNSGATAATLSSVAFDLSAGDSAGGTVTVYLYANVSGAPGTTAVTTLGTFNDNTVSTLAAGAYLTLNFSSTYTLAANTTYWIGLSDSSATQGPSWHYTTTTGQPSSDTHSGVSSTTEMLMIVNNSLCFAAGAQVLTARGEVGVETLVEGDLVVGIRGGRLQPVRWVGHREVDLLAHPDPDSINPVRVCADAFGPGQPHRDMILSPNHALYVDGHFIAVRYLLNGVTIRQEHWDSVTYYHVELESHDVMLVDGMTAESFLDIGNRGAFSNGGEPVMLHPDFARQTWEAEACAPDLPKGAELTHLRAVLLERAAVLGHTLSDDPDLCVVVGKRSIRPIETKDGFRFNLPKGTRTVKIVSRCFKPSEMRAEGNDSRILGIGVQSLMLDDTLIALDDARLTVGWYEPEPGLRWTKGAASLRTAGAHTLTIGLFRGRHYWVSGDPTQNAHAAA